jgi:hypothetical protein
MSYKAQWEEKTAPLFGDFGRDYAMRHFGLTLEQLEALVGRYTKGKYKGQLRGQIVWHVVTRGGWVKTGAYDFDAMQGNGFVCKPGLRFGHAIQDRWTGDTKLGANRGEYGDDSCIGMIQDALRDTPEERFARTARAMAEIEAAKGVQA